MKTLLGLCFVLSVIICSSAIDYCSLCDVICVKNGAKNTLARVLRPPKKEASTTAQVKTTTDPLNKTTSVLPTNSASSSYRKSKAFVFQILMS